MCACGAHGVMHFTPKREVTMCFIDIKQRAKKVLW